MKPQRNPDLPLVLQQQTAYEPAEKAQDTGNVNHSAQSVAASARWPQQFTRRNLALGALALLCMLGLFYPVENVVTAIGQVIPSDRVQTVQHLEGGIVTSVHVREGQVVSKGQPLLEIDLGGGSLNLEQLTARQATARAIKIRLSAESQGRPLKASDFPADLDQAIVQAELGAFAARALEQKGSLASARALQHQSRGEVAQAQAKVSGLEASLQLYQKEASIASQLVAEELIGQLEVIDKQKALEQVRTDLATTRQTLVSSQAKVAQAEAKLLETEGAFRRRASEELAQTERELLSLSEDLSRAQSQRARTQVSAPTDGIVKGLRSSGSGWVVKPGEAILEIVPSKDEIIVEARLNPSDRGYVHPGQATQAKITAYDFLRYGFVPGQIILVAADADRDPNQPDAQSYFRIQASLEQPWVGRTDNRITTGMQAELDLLLGREPFIWYLLRPVLRIQSEAFREP